MADFSQAQEFVKQAEGGYTDDPRDRGNYVDSLLIGTNHGISAPILKSWLGRTPTVAEMKNLSYKTALQIYKANYWDALALTLINNQSIALLIYDGAVNQGVSRIKGVVVDSLRDVGVNASRQDRPNDLAVKINGAPQQRLYDAIKKNRKASYSSESPFYAGWMNRLNNLAFTISEKTKGVVKGVVKQVENRKTSTIVAAVIVTAVVATLIIYRKEIASKINKIR